MPPTSNYTRTAVIVEAGMIIGLAAVLSLISFARLPMGGKLSLEMLPIYFFAFRHGWKAGVFAGFLFGLVLMIIDPMFVHPVQIVMDYPLPFMLVGFAGFFEKKMWLGMIIGGAGRFACHFLSGIVFFGAYAPEGMPVWQYSLIYNSIYIPPQVIISMILVPVVLKRVGKG